MKFKLAGFKKVHLSTFIEFKEHVYEEPVHSSIRHYTIALHTCTESLLLCSTSAQFCVFIMYVGTED